ncbi:MAG: hypothetical protein NVS9B14_12880 [Candidatus Acidiferrum sp.]
MQRNWIFYLAGIVGAVLQAGGAPAPPPHIVQTATCCGMAIAVDQTNLASIAECLPGDASCQQGIAICLADGTCEDVPAGSAASIRYWKKYSAAAGLPQRLDVVVANISSHASRTTVGWTQTQGAPLP